jgi:FAD/FMN-containing dehydrogenase
VIAIDSTLRGTAQIFDNPAAGALSLMRRLKAVFDPAGIFNPDAMDCLT